MIYGNISGVLYFITIDNFEDNNSSSSRAETIANFHCQQQAPLFGDKLA